MTKLSQFCLKASLSVQTLTGFSCCWGVPFHIMTVFHFDGFPLCPKFFIWRLTLVSKLWFFFKVFPFDLSPSLSVQTFTNLFCKASLSVLTFKKNSKASLSVQTLTVFCFFEGFSLFYLMASPSVLTLIFPFVSKSLCQKFQKKFGKASRTLTIFFVGWLPFVSKVFLYLMASPSVQTWILWLP